VSRDDLTAPTMSSPKLALNEPGFLNRDDIDPKYDSPLLDWALSVVFAPLQLLLRALSFAFQLARPYAPQLVPIAIGLALLPLLGLGSLSAGFVVWKSSAVSWEHPVYLQYGYVCLCGCESRVGRVTHAVQRAATVSRHTGRYYWRWQQCSPTTYLCT
jgi:hypothetical protein